MQTRQNRRGLWRSVMVVAASYHTFSSLGTLSFHFRSGVAWISSSRRTSAWTTGRMAEASNGASQIAVNGHPEFTEIVATVALSFPAITLTHTTPTQMLP